VLEEDLTNSEHVRRFRIEAHVPHMPFVKTIVIWEGQNIGHKAICRFPLIPVNGLDIRILEADGEWSIRSAALYNCSHKDQS
jgi:alpha-L-fucosidase